MRLRCMLADACALNACPSAHVLEPSCHAGPSKWHQLAQPCVSRCTHMLCITVQCQGSSCGVEALPPCNSLCARGARGARRMQVYHQMPQLSVRRPISGPYTSMRCGNVQGWGGGSPLQQS